MSSEIQEYHIVVNVRKPDALEKLTFYSQCVRIIRHRKPSGQSYHQEPCSSQTSSSKSSTGSPRLARTSPTHPPYHLDTSESAWCLRQNVQVVEQLCRLTAFARRALRLKTEGSDQGEMCSEKRTYSQQPSHQPCPGTKLRTAQVEMPRSRNPVILFSVR